MFLLLLAPGGVPVAGEAHGRECVILLHGLLRTSGSMERLAGYLEERGYRVLNVDYPSRDGSIGALAEGYVSTAVRRCREEGCGTVHFVTHSLGGILVRQYLQNGTVPPGSRVVMLSPPNGGTEVADFFGDVFFYRWITGPAGEELGTGVDSTPNRLAPIDAPVGIIAGTRSYNPLFSVLIPGTDDGTVGIERMKLEEMADYIEVPCGHFFMMNNAAVMRQTAYFLERGVFDHDGGR